MKYLRLILLCCLIWLIFLGAPALGREAALRLLYVNDFHGFAEPYQPLGSPELLGGAAYLAGSVDRLRKERPTLLLAAGDLIQGNNWANLFRGKSSIKLMNAMRFDAMAVGNHEFDFGQKVLQELIREARFPVLGANVQGLARLKPYVIKTVGGIRVAIIGVVTPDTAVTTNPRNVAGLKFSPPEVAVAKCLKELKGKADLMVVLSHLGYPEDRVLAQKAPGIDVIIGGHTHTRLETPAMVNHTIICQAWEHAKALGVLDLDLKDGKIVNYAGHLEEIKPSAGHADAKILPLVAQYSRQVNARLDKIVGETEVDLDGEQVRSRETNLGDLVADIMRAAAGADAALINGGSIRASLHRGAIKAKDVYTALPFDNYVVAIRLTGRQLREALEHGVSAWEEKAGRFPQVSGLCFTYRRNAPAGSRVKEVQVQGLPLDHDKKYLVATNDFLAAGGDGYLSFGEALKSGEGYREQGGALTSKNLAYANTGVWLRDLVINYIKGKKTISPQVEGRIKALD
ncbi:MAG: 5'-nucleotidase C-terminal domain-containing protein [Deltaproteobacteria bacterium]|nr:5'-nucleotidase C-terminal domain-containing protein [Deltaproteobacteria bacterium]